MIDLDTDKVILAKSVRRKRFILGKSVALERVDVAVMDDGSVRVITERRADYWDGRAPLFVCFKARKTADGENFDQTVQRIREYEAQYTTAELPELV